MKLSSPLHRVLFVSALFTSAAFAQEQAAQPADVAAVAEAVAPTAVEEAQTAQPASGASYSQQVTDAIGTPAAGKGLLVFYRPGKFTGAAIGIKVRENDIQLGKLGNGSYFAVEVEPGKHVFMVTSDAKDAADVEVAAGETQFLVGSISMGFMSGNQHLGPSDVASFESVLEKLKKAAPAK